MNNNKQSVKRKSVSELTDPQLDAFYESVEMAVDTLLGCPFKDHSINQTQCAFLVAAYVDKAVYLLNTALESLEKSL